MRGVRGCHLVALLPLILILVGLLIALIAPNFMWSAAAPALRW